MAVVIMGIVFSAEKTAISPEVQGFVHNFWEMIGYLANTVLFVIVGILISESAINSITATDVYYLIVLYFTLNVARFGINYADSYYCTNDSINSKPIGYSLLL